LTEDDVAEYAFLVNFGTSVDSIMQAPAAFNVGAYKNRSIQV